jgi:hypothetical protein
MNPDRVVATIAGQKLTAGEFESLVEGMPPQLKAQVMGPAKRQFIEHYAMVQILAKQAAQMHIDQHPSVQLQMAYAKDMVLYNMLAKAMVDNARVDPNAVKAYYDEHKNDFQQVTVHHILIRFKGSQVPLKPGQADLSDEEALAKAEAIIKRLKAGEDFEAIAKVESDDTGSAAKGGVMPTFRRGQMVTAFENVAFSSPEGKIADPVKTQFGYHVVRVDKLETTTLEQARKEIEARLKPEVAQKQMDDLRANAGVTLDEKYFGPSTPSASTPKAPSK